jgi:hypothetical protein
MTSNVVSNRLRCAPDLRIGRTSRDPDAYRLDEARRLEAPEYERLVAFEEIGFSPGAAAVLVEPLSGDERLELLTDRMLAEDTSRFDLEGQVW